MFNFLSQFDRISFFLGFLAATLFWWVIARIRPMLPLWRQQVRQQWQMLSQRNFAGVDAYLRREVLRSAQRQHLAAGLFSLDEVLIEPALLSPPGGQEPGTASPYPSISARVLPYLPDWPEITAPYDVPAVRPDQALQSGRHLALIGHPGSGKTVALAHLATQLARRDEAVRAYDDCIVLYLHVLDLDTTHSLDQAPLESLIKAVAGGATVMMQPQINRYLRAAFRSTARNSGAQRRVLLLMDGLDELPGEQFHQAAAFLAALLQAHPRIQAVVTAPVDTLDGLTRAGFYPLALAAWSHRQRAELAGKWGQLWNEQLLPEAEKRGPAPRVDSLLMDHWLSSESAYASPLEWTLRVWGAYTGDLSGSNPLTVLETHITRFLPSPAQLPALIDMAHWMLRQPASSAEYGEVETFLNQTRAGSSAMPAAVQAESPPDAPDAAVQDEGEKPPRKKGKRQPGRGQESANPAEDLVAALLRGGVLVEHGNHLVRFASPVFLGFLAGLRLNNEEAAAAVQALDWPAHGEALRYAAAASENPEWIYPLVEAAEPPLFSGLLQAARWLRDAPPDAEWRSYVMRLLVAQIQNESVPPGMRVRMAAAFYLSRDPAAGKLFKQLLLSRSAVARRAALLGLGAQGNPQSIKDILDLLADPDATVRQAACMALAALPGENALNAAVEIMLTGDEELRQAAAESLAMNPVEGHQILEEAASVDDLLTRRAAVFGLLQVGNEMAHKRLEKIAIEDGQWVVRNAAAQALEMLQQTAPGIPRQLPPPHDSPWLLTFASKLGMGILPGQPGTDVLLAVLKSGTVEEQVAALHYLREQPDEGIIAAIYRLLYSEQAELSEPALHALWWLRASGARLPSPVMFGLG